MKSEQKTKFTIMFDGTLLHGWQVQKNVPTVQSTVQDALYKIFGERLSVTGCSRTDAGVHARNFVCCLDRTVNMENSAFVSAMNANLPDFVRVKEAETADAAFHPRYSCIGKEYVYNIWNEKYSNPFLRNYAMFYPRFIDIDKISFVGEELCGKHDFTSFMAKGSKITDDTVREIKYCKFSKDGGLLKITVCADGFLYNMVRIIAGTVLYASQGKIKKGGIAGIIDAKDRSFAGPTAPACGLFLNRVFY